MYRFQCYKVLYISSALGAVLFTFQRIKLCVFSNVCNVVYFTKSTRSEAKYFTASGTLGYKVRNKTYLMFLAVYKQTPTGMQQTKDTNDPTVFLYVCKRLKTEYSRFYYIVNY